jgi:hypothetical protein
VKRLKSWKTLQKRLKHQKKRKPLIVLGVPITNEDMLAEYHEKWPNGIPERVIEYFMNYVARNGNIKRYLVSYVKNQDIQN